MASLPSASNPLNWGTAYNEFLQVAHNADGTMKVATEIAFTNYSSTSTITGWTTFTTKLVYVIKVGNLVFVSYYIQGESNANSASFTVPDTPSMPANVAAYSNTYDGAAGSSSGRLAVTNGSTTISVYPSATGTTWNKSGTKLIQGQFWYLTA